MEGRARISTDILARYAGDAARESPGVAGLIESPLHRHAGVRISGEHERPDIVVHLRAEWDTPLQVMGKEIQRRIADYLGRMADVHPATIDVVIEEIETS
jgi:uncharacterized alkaline shock family protein YloU